MIHRPHSQSVFTTFPSVESSSNEHFSQQGQWIMQNKRDSVFINTTCLTFSECIALIQHMLNCNYIHYFDVLVENFKYLKTSSRKKQTICVAKYEWESLIWEEECICLTATVGWNISYYMLLHWLTLLFHLLCGLLHPNIWKVNESCSRGISCVLPKCWANSLNQSMKHFPSLAFLCLEINRQSFIAVFFQLQCSLCSPSVKTSHSVIFKMRNNTKDLTAL